MLKLFDEKQIYVKISKCVFRVHKVEYLGHIIFLEGGKVDYNKIKEIKESKTPTTPNNLQGFFGLTRYYWKFFKYYVIIEVPLTQLLNKYAFSWTLEGTKAL